MQGRYRNADEGRGYNSNPSFRNFNNRNKLSHNRSNSFNRKSHLPPPPPPPPPPPSKQEILMRAGKLAAEYLASQGLLDPEKLPQSRGQNGKFQDFRGHNRAANSKRYDDDDYDDDSFRGKRRMSEYDRDYDDNETDDDYTRGVYRRERKSGFDQLPARSENTMESGSENQDINEDSGSKFSSLSWKKDALHEVVCDNVVVNSEVNDEVKSDVSADVSNKKSLAEDNVGESGQSGKNDALKVVAQENPEIEAAVNAEVKNIESNGEENETEIIVPEESNKRKREENDSPVRNVKGKELSPDEEVVAPISAEEGNAEGKIDMNIQEEQQQLISEPFKTCDLNFVNAPEVTDIPSDTEPAEIDNGKEFSIKIELPATDNSSRGGVEIDKIPGDADKVVQVISLEDDVAVDASGSDTSKPRDEEPTREEPVYPNLDSFLNQPEHADLSSIQSGYSLEFSDFLEPSVPTHLTNLESGMEGVRNDDGPIYGPLDGMPIDFMEVWEPAQDYEKFF